ncbi:MAG: GH92 family glycosyl hydrolase [Bacteroidales bacterium]
MHNKTITSFLFIILIIGMMLGCASEEKQPVDYVNPYIGNISHLLVPTYPTVNLPNSFLRVYPNRESYTDVSMEGFPLIIVNHRGNPAFHLSPFQGDEKNIEPVMSYSYDNEKITPYSWSVYLDEQQSEINFGVSHQSAMYQVDFNREGAAYLILNSENGMLKWDGKAISGYQSVDNETKAFVHLAPEQSPREVYVLEDSELIGSQQAEGENATLILKFPENAGTVNLRYGISFIDEAQAKSNMEREVAGKDMGTLHVEGRKIWNEALGKIEVEGGSEDDKTIFYTALYRTYERPVSISEDGRYFSAFDGQVHDDQGIPFYTDDWIWDSYRAHHPLNILINPEKEMYILRSFVRMAEQMDHFWAPIFPGINGNRAVMNSNHIVGTFLDAYRKGIKDFNLKKAYRASKNVITEQTLAPWSADTAGYLNAFYQEHGYIPALHPDEEETVPQVDDFESRQAVAVTLGTAYDEWCLSQMAKKLDKKEDYRHFSDRAYNYRKLFHPETHFFHPKDKNGDFIQPFDYKFSGDMGARDYYDENNGWIYRWEVTHNVADLIDLMGGREAFTSNLDALFDEPLGKPKYQFYAQLPDHTGNVGQFSMGNEPSFHIPYLYNYAGQPWKTQKRIGHLLKQWFRNDLMGIPGDEDGGAMSAFVVFSYMGFYPVTPGLPMYNIGSPVFDEVTIHLSNGKDFTIMANNNSSNKKYIQSATFNGNSIDKPWFLHEKMRNGGALKLEMGSKANRQWGSEKEAAPPSFNLSK